MTESDTTSGRIWITELAGPTQRGRSERRVKVAASERLDLDRSQCCQSCDLILDPAEAREVGERLLQFAAEAGKAAGGND